MSVLQSFVRGLLVVLVPAIAAAEQDAPVPTPGPTAAPRAKPPRTNRDEGPVYVDPQNVDDDYALQGEYRGWQRGPRGGDARQAGLQVVALGDDQFGASNYLGGLPGEGWFGGERRLFSGERKGPRVVLSRPGERLVVQPAGATLYDDANRRLGEFHKVHRQSPTMGVLPPPGAVMLFGSDGDTGHFVNATRTAEGYLQAGTQTLAAYSDFRLHAEFRIPFKPQARGQARGNSGFYLQSRYEVQVLDSFGLEGVENECGALYKTKRPDFNMCFPPLVWQTYDIDLTSPRFDADGNKISNMRISVWHNGVLIQNDAEIPDKTGAGKPETPLPLPTKLQDHGNPVVYRNIWLIDTSAATPSAGLAMSDSEPRP